MSAIDEVQIVGPATVTFNTGVADANGTIWWCELPIDGWDGPDTTQFLTDDMGADGQVMGLSQYSSRHLTVKGWAAGGVPSKARQTLATATSMVHAAGSLIVYEPDATKTLVVWRNGRLHMDKGEAGEVTFEIPLVAPNPFKTGSGGPWI